MMRLQQLLVDAGVPVWRDLETVLPGQDWKLEVRRAVDETSFAFLACFSEHSAIRDKSYQNEELALAVDQMRLRRPGRPWLIPIRFADVEIPRYSLGAGRLLSDLQSLDLIGDQWERNGRRLLAAVIAIFNAQRP